MKKTVLIIQSGAMGDIFLVAPIARYYFLQGYLVYWPVRYPYYNVVSKYLSYVNALLIEDKKFPSLHADWLRSDTMHLRDIAKRGHYDVVLDLSDRGSKPLELPGETFEQTKYRLSNVPFAHKNHLFWDVNNEKEQDLITIIEENYDININKQPYVIAHLESSHGDRAELPKKEIRDAIEITKIPDFEIPDWYPIIEKAKAIYCVESSVHQFIDGCYHRLKSVNPTIEFYLLRRSSLNPGQRYTVSEYWDKRYL